ncbi:hypothetical protein [Polyangium mundeleinium]|uniref:Uncharacterized protein n=1 Tax=Polyangium mundeleinium TaxID=2995306 RepID=A0ABT5EHM8_9BACT|nr:hypothetical protein [Polyangium mundeleinium]MDC0741317.1 hypothetical protein [Polyangium mundeleinium]
MQALELVQERAVRRIGRRRAALAEEQTAGDVDEQRLAEHPEVDRRRVAGRGISALDELDAEAGAAEERGLSGRRFAEDQVTRHLLARGLVLDLLDERGLGLVEGGADLGRRIGFALALGELQGLLRFFLLREEERVSPGHDDRERDQAGDDFEEGADGHVASSMRSSTSSSSAVR